MDQTFNHSGSRAWATDSLGVLWPVRLATPRHGGAYPLDATKRRRTSWRRQDKERDQRRTDVAPMGLGVG